MNSMSVSEQLCEVFNNLRVATKAGIKWGLIFMICLIYGWLLICFLFASATIANQLKGMKLTRSHQMALPFVEEPSSILQGLMQHL
jgi:hypothetical protein